VTADHIDYEALGIPVGQHEVNLEEGAALELAIRAPRTEALITRLCNGKPPLRRMATLRVTILDSATAEPVRGLVLKLSWKEFGGSPGGLISSRSPNLQGTTDSRGGVTFCELPADQPLNLVIVRDRGESAVAEIRLRQDDLDARVFRVTTRR
jgi:hypothetical protein